MLNVQVNYSIKLVTLPFGGAGYEACVALHTAPRSNYKPVTPYGISTRRITSRSNE